MAMSDAELWQLQQMASSNAVTSFSLLLTTVFAYLVAAYLAGHRLNGFQALVLSTLFVVGAGLLGLNIVGLVRRALFFTDLLRQRYPGEFFVMSRGMVGLIAALIVGAIPVSLYFMYQIRRDAGPGARGRVNDQR
jgi:hypothetical protein